MRMRGWKTSHAKTGNSRPVPATERLLSVDALRGFDMFWIIGGDGVAGAIITFFSPFGSTGVAAAIAALPMGRLRFP